MPTHKMKYFENIILLVLLFNLNLEQKLYLASNESWILKWSDHFNTNTLKPSIWKITELVQGYYCYDRKYQIIEQNLYLTTEKLQANRSMSKNKCKLRSTMFETRFGMAYGKFEINASLQYNRAVAFLTLWPIEQTYGKSFASGFIHILRQNNQLLKRRRKDTSFGIRYGYGFNEYKFLDPSEELPLNTGFHLFSLEWNKTDMVWKIDENIYYNVSIDRYFIKSSEGEEERYEEKGQPFDHKFKLQITDQFYPSTELKDLDDNFTESQFIIDYVKYFALNGSEISLNSTSIANSTSADSSDGETTTGIFNEYSISLIVALLIILLVMPVLFVFYIRRVKRNTKLKNKVAEEDYADVIVNNEYDQYIDIGEESAYEDVEMMEEVNDYYDIDESNTHHYKKDIDHKYLDIF